MLMIDGHRDMHERKAIPRFESCSMRRGILVNGGTCHVPAHSSGGRPSLWATAKPPRKDAL